MEFVIGFLQDRWFVVLGVLIALLIIIKIVKTVVKWVIVLVLVAGLFYYGASYTDQLMAFGTMAAEELKEQALKVVEKEMQEAKYETRPDGSFIVKTRSLQLEGQPDSSELAITFWNRTFTVNAEGMWTKMIEEAKKNAGLQP